MSRALPNEDSIGNIVSARKRCLFSRSLNPHPENVGCGTRHKSQRDKFGFDWFGLAQMCVIFCGA